MQDKVISSFHDMLKSKYDKQCVKNPSIILILQCIISNVLYLIMMYDQKWLWEYITNPDINFLSKKKKVCTQCLQIWLYKDGLGT